MKKKMTGSILLENRHDGRGCGSPLVTLRSQHEGEKTCLVESQNKLTNLGS